VSAKQLKICYLLLWHTISAKWRGVFFTRAGALIASISRRLQWEGLQTRLVHIALNHAILLRRWVLDYADRRLLPLLLPQSGTLRRAKVAACSKACLTATWQHMSPQQPTRTNPPGQPTARSSSAQQPPALMCSSRSPSLATACQQQQQQLLLSLPPAAAAVVAGCIC
jgi:hypothetical protein